MRIRVLFFAGLKDIIGVSEIEMELPENSTAGAAMEELTRKYPGIGKTRQVKFAIDNVYAANDDALTENCELALFPPVSGG